MRAVAVALLLAGSVAPAMSFAASTPTPSLRLPLPAAPAHAEYVVETNKKGQVTRVRSGTPSKDRVFNTLTYGNALQAFIRTPEDRSIAGTYRLSYDYDPKKKTVRRTVSLIRAGGVDPNALGAIDQAALFNRRQLLKAAKPTASPPRTPKATPRSPSP